VIYSESLVVKPGDFSIDYCTFSMRALEGILLWTGEWTLDLMWRYLLQAIIVVEEVTDFAYFLIVIK
jgi:hypothetical protein